jgi:hypothetical protein
MKQSGDNSAWKKKKSQQLKYYYAIVFCFNQWKEPRKRKTTNDVALKEHVKRRTYSTER